MEIKSQRPNYYTRENLHDEIADIVDWNPIRVSQSSFDLYRISAKDNTIQRFYPTKTHVLASLSIAFFPLLPLLDHGWQSNVILSCFLLSMSVVGIIWSINILLIKQFNNMDKAYEDHSLTFTGFNKTYIKYKDIKAIQILQSTPTSSDYDNYEMNLILNNGNRINITSYYSRYNLRQDAICVSQLSGTPIWQGDW